MFRAPPVIQGRSWGKSALPAEPAMALPVVSTRVMKPRAPCPMGPRHASERLRGYTKGPPDDRGAPSRKR